MDSKKKTFTDPRQKRDDVHASRWVFKQVMLGLLAHYAADLVWVDETATYMDMTRTHGRALKGRRAPGVRRRKYRRYTLVVAMTLRGVLASRLIQGGMKAKDWVAFVQEDLAPLLRPGQYVQWDNLNLHFDPTAFEAVVASGARVIYQPAYSPETNPIEEAFSLLKSKLRSCGAKTLGALRQAIAQGFAAITPAHMAAYWTHTYQIVAAWPEIGDDW